MQNESHSKSSARKSTPISWIVERDALLQFGDRRTRAILAIFASRRGAGKPVFFVPPHIAEYFRLTPRDLFWAHSELEGKLLETIGSKRGKFRRVRLLPEWEERETSTRTWRQGDRKQASAVSVEAANAPPEVAVMLADLEVLEQLAPQPNEFDISIVETLIAIARGEPDT